MVREFNGFGNQDQQFRIELNKQTQTGIPRIRTETDMVDAPLFSRHNRTGQNSDNLAAFVFGDCIVSSVALRPSQRYHIPVENVENGT